MNEPTDILSAVNALSYDFLKQKGLEYIRQLSGRTWQDYHEHDPGVTILETLCYALMDLEYRTNFPIEDILAPSPDQNAASTPKHFYEAEEILPCNPLTHIDFLKVVLDVEGVRNARLISQSRQGEIQGGYSVLVDVEDKVRQLQREHSVIEKIASRLSRHRNLCEDFFEIKLLEPFWIRLHATIEVKRNLDHEAASEFCAVMLSHLNDFISPHVNFYALQNMLFDKGKTVEEAFRGPVLTQGFLDQDELERSAFKPFLYISELIGQMTSFTLVSSVSDCTLATEKGGEIEKMVLSVPSNYVPKIAIQESHIELRCNDVPLVVHADRVQRRFREISHAHVLQRPYFNAETIAIPKGRYRALADYTSIQHDFPLLYGVGQEGLPSSAASSRKAKAKQLQGYLMFFDQVMTNYLAKLSNIREIMSVQPQRSHPIHSSHALRDVPHLQQLLRPLRTPAAEDFEFRLQRKYLGYKVTDKPPSAGSSASLHYQSSLDRLSAHRRYTSKDAMLNHLLSRYAETMEALPLAFADMSAHKQLKEAAYSKERFLKDYAAIGHDRNRGLCLTKDDDRGWDSHQVTGFEKRIMHLLGISNGRRRYLHTLLKDCFYTEHYLERRSLTSFKQEVVDQRRMLLFEGKLPQIRDIAIAQGVHASSYDVRPASEGGYEVILYADRTHTKYIQLDSKSAPIKTLKQAKEAIGKALELFRRFSKDSEGFHLVEHILLRDSTTYSGSTDPYSFTMTMVFPAWPARFRSDVFRRSVQELVLNESPAHLYVHILWLELSDMEVFERAYKKWIDLYACAPAEDPERKRAAKSLLSTIMTHVDRQAP